MKERVRKPDMGGLLTLLLFGVFAVCVLSVLLTGADAYRHLTERDQASYERRTAAQYIATRVRQGDLNGGVSVEEFGGVSALCLREDFDGETYLTRVYCHDGYIWELFTDAASQFFPEDGEKLMESGGLTFQLESGLLTVEITNPDGTAEQLTLLLRSGEGAAS